MRNNSEIYKKVVYNLYSDDHFIQYFKKPYDQMSNGKRASLWKSLRSCRSKKSFKGEPWTTGFILDPLSNAYHLHRRANDKRIYSTTEMEKRVQEIRAIKAEIIKLNELLTKRTVTYDELEKMEARLNGDFDILFSSATKDLKLNIANSKAKSAMLTISSKIRNFPNSTDNLSLINDILDFESRNRKLLDALHEIDRKEINDLLREKRSSICLGFLKNQYLQQKFTTVNDDTIIELANLKNKYSRIYNSVFGENKDQLSQLEKSTLKKATDIYDKDFSDKLSRIESNKNGYEQLKSLGAELNKIETKSRIKLPNLSNKLISKKEIVLNQLVSEELELFNDVVNYRNEIFDLLQFNAWEKIFEKNFGDARSFDSVKRMFDLLESKKATIIQNIELYGSANSLMKLGLNYLYGENGLERMPEKGLELLLKSAKKGNGEAARFAAGIYHFGAKQRGNYNDDKYSYLIDLDKALFWYKKAFELSKDGFAAYNVGRCYKNGIGVEKNIKQAASWYRKSAEVGFDEGQFAYGNALLLGEGVPLNINEANKWYEKAAKQGHAKSQYNIGYDYYFRMGKKDPKYEKLGIDWLKKSADNGNPKAQTFVGAAYASGGIGLPKNISLAKSYLRKAINQGDEGAKEIWNKFF